MIKSSPSIHIQHKIRNIAKSVRGTVDLYTNFDINNENNIEFGAGVIIAPTIISNFGNMSNLSIENVGYHIFGHTKNVSSDIQILKNGIDIDSVLKITDNIYIGTSYSNLLDIDGITGIAGSCFIYSSFEHSLKQTNIMSYIHLMS